MFRLAAGAVFISFSPVFVRLSEVPPTVSGFYRTLIGGAVLTLIVRLRREPFFDGPRALFVLIVAAVFFAADLWFWHRSILIVGPGLATLLASFQVFVLAAAGVLLLREGIRWELLLSIPMALVGLGMIVGFDWGVLEVRYRLGVIFGLMAALLYAGYLLSLRWARLGPHRSSSFGDLAVVCIVTTLLLGWFAWAEGLSLRVTSLPSLAWLTAYGVLGQVIGWVLISSAVHQLPAAKVGLVILLQPVLTYVWDMLFFDRVLSTTQAAGAALALGAIYLGSRPVRKELP